MDYFPLFARLQNQPCLIVGGGEVALRKAKLLLRAGADLTVLAPNFHAELKRLAQAHSHKGGLTLHAKHFTPDVSLADYQLIVAATDDEILNAMVAQTAATAGVFCNVVDDREQSTAIMPAIIDRSPIVIAVSSGGASPVLATRIRKQLEQLFPAQFADLAKFADRWRNRVKASFGSITERRRIWQRVFDSTIAEHVLAGDEQLAAKQMEALLDGNPDTSGYAWIAGAGPGDPELLTLKTARALASADVILHDRLVSAAILDMARRDAEFISVGKEAGKPSISQAAINELLVEKVAAGHRVCRLKGGDPFIFGRGGEEIEALQAAGLPWEVIPGITAASGCAAATGTPLTHRQMARSVTLITASMADDTKHDWSRYSGADQTLVIYMAVKNLQPVCAELINNGRSADTPALIIENGTTVRQRMIRGTLTSIPADAGRAGIGSPAVLIIGHVGTISRLIEQPTQSGTDGGWADAAQL